MSGQFSHGEQEADPFSERDFANGAMPDGKGGSALNGNWILTASAISINPSAL